MFFSSILLFLKFLKKKHDCFFAFFYSMIFLFFFGLKQRKNMYRPYFRGLLICLIVSQGSFWCKCILYSENFLGNSFCFATFALMCFLLLTFFNTVWCNVSRDCL